MTLETHGWQVFTPEPELRAWADHANGVADGILAEPKMQAAWLRHGRTWFAGVDVLPNDSMGRLAGGPDLAGAAIDAARKICTAPLHAGQLSVTYPGYPKQDTGESDGNHRFRVKRDAAHVDGLLPIGPHRRRKLREPHGYTLGLPLNHTPPEAAPLVVWAGSHRIIGAALAAVLVRFDLCDWPEVDLTDAYHTARRQCFETCQRVPLHVAPGGAILLHRHLLHGVAPWAAADEGERRIVYFRPEYSDLGRWISAL